MINQRLSQSLRTLARQQAQNVRTQRSSITPSPFTSTSFAPATASRLAGQRWYSEAQQQQSAKKEETGDQAASEKVQEEAMKVDPVQKELEAKKREVIDLTVCLSTQKSRHCEQD